METYIFTVGFLNGTMHSFKIEVNSPYNVAKRIISKGLHIEENRQLFSPNVIAGVWWNKEGEDIDYVDVGKWFRKEYYKSIRKEKKDG